MNVKNQRKAALIPAGTVFGYLQVLYRVQTPPTAKNSRYWVRCLACGKEKDVARCALVCGNTRSCGCQKSRLGLLSCRVSSLDVRRIKDGIRSSALVKLPRVRARSQRCPLCQKARRSLQVALARNPKTGELEVIGQYCRRCHQITRYVLTPIAFPVGADDSDGTALAPELAPSNDIR